MIGLLLLAVLILAGTVWLLARPVVPATEGRGEQYHQLQLVRERLLVQLRELETESTSQGMDAQVASDEQQRLEAELAEVLRTLEALETASSGDNAERPLRSIRRTVTVALSVALPLVTALLFVGSNQATIAKLISRGGGEVAQSQQVPPMVLNMVARLEKRLAEQPDDAAGWARLGRSYEVLQRPADSRKAYAMAYKLAPNNVEILADYAALLYGENPQNTQGKVFELFSRLQRLEPRHPGALWFLGLAAFQKGEFSTAVTLWAQLKAQLPADSPVTSQLAHAIAQAQGRLRQQ